MNVLEAKIAPNEWKRVDHIYKEVPDIKAYFRNENDAKLFKSKLKAYLKQYGNKTNLKKRPIRLRKI